MMNVANSLFWTDCREAVCPLKRYTIFQSTSLDKLACVSDFLRLGLSTIAIRPMRSSTYSDRSVFWANGRKTGYRDNWLFIPPGRSFQVTLHSGIDNGSVETWRISFLFGCYSSVAILELLNLKQTTEARQHH
jgi:hypothetical protein